MLYAASCTPSAGFGYFNIVEVHRFLFILHCKVIRCFGMKPIKRLGKDLVKYFPSKTPVLCPSSLEKEILWHHELKHEVLVLFQGHQVQVSSWPFWACYRCFSVKVPVYHADLINRFLSFTIERLCVNALYFSTSKNSLQTSLDRPFLCSNDFWKHCWGTDGEFLSFFCLLFFVVAAGSHVSMNNRWK